MVIEIWWVSLGLIYLVSLTRPLYKATMSVSTFQYRKSLLIHEHHIFISIAFFALAAALLDSAPV